MTDSANALSSWESFYVIVGSSGGALIGLQFVVMTLIAGSSRRRTNMGAMSAFGTPTVVHLTGALLVSAIMSAPFTSIAALSVALGIVGIAGLVYGAIVVRRAHRQTDYAPVREDWVWYITLPFLCYAALTVTAAVLRSDPPHALFVIGAAALGLLLIGIHNAWDTVVHIVSTAGDDTAKSE